MIELRTVKTGYSVVFMRIKAMEFDNLVKSKMLVNIWKTKCFIGFVNMVFLTNEFHQNTELGVC